MPLRRKPARFSTVVEPRLWAATTRANSGRVTSILRNLFRLRIGLRRQAGLQARRPGRRAATT